MNQIDQCPSKLSVYKKDTPQCEEQLFLSNLTYNMSHKQGPSQLPTSQDTPAPLIARRSVPLPSRLPL